MQVSDITGRVGRLLSDPTHVRWSESELIDYINDAQKQVVLLVPDANARTDNFKLMSGSRQTLPAGSIRLLRVVRNMGTTGNSPGFVVYPTLRSALDAEIPHWHTETGASVRHYIYDPDSDRMVFYVYPSATGYLEIVYSTNPETATSLNSTLELNEQYINPIVDWVLYRCWAKDAEYAGNASRAQMHEQSFYSQLGVKREIANLADPVRRVRNFEIEER